VAGGSRCTPSGDRSADHDAGPHFGGPAVGRHLTFFYDEWTWILGRRGGSLATYLDPHNGHLSLFPVIIYKILFGLVGLRHYWPYRLIDVVFDLTSAALVYVLAARRLGRWLALLPAVLLALLGSAWQDLLWPFQIGFLGSVAAGLGAFVILDRRQPSRGTDGAATALLIYAVGSSAIGLAYLVAAAVMLVAQRAPWRRLWIVAVPAALFLIWYVGWGTSEQVTGSSLLGTPQYVADAASAAFAGVAGLSDTYGPPILVAALLAIALGVRRRRSAILPLLLAAVAGALVFWGLSAIVRSSQAQPGASRYLYVGAVFIILAVAEAAEGIRLGPAALAVACVLTAGALVANLNLLREGKDGLQTADNNVTAALAATSIAAPVVTPTFVPSQFAPQIAAGPYLSAARALGTPAPSVAGLEQSAPGIQAIADRTLTLAEDIAAVPSTAGPPCKPAPLASPAGGVRVNPGRELVIEPQSAPTQIYLRRFGSTLAPAPFAPLPAHTAAIIRFPGDLAPAVPWTVVPAGTPAPLACVA
jgi:hypothetical protein